MASNVKKIKRSELKYAAEIGRGSFSSVYRMTWERGFGFGPLDVAAKRLNRRDLHELQMLSGLDHPNIVKLLGIVDEATDFMLILELCEGGSLRSFLDKGNRLSQEQFYDWAKQAALPLEYLKQNHLVHKDVKSPNYMITAGKTLKLGDFGIAKNIEETTYSATETATYAWMAPELLTENILSPKYDIFSYGIVLWEMLTGKFPFAGLEPHAIMWRVCNENERLPIPDDCPEPVRELIERCWETDWKLRPEIEEVISRVRINSFYLSVNSIA